MPELVEAARRQLLRIASEASQPWGSPAAKEEWHNSVTNQHAPLSEQARGHTNGTQYRHTLHILYCTHTTWYMVCTK